MSAIEEKHSRRFAKGMSQEPYVARPGAAVPHSEDSIPFYHLTICTARAGKKKTVGKPSNSV